MYACESFHSTLLHVFSDYRVRLRMCVCVSGGEDSSNKINHRNYCCFHRSWVEECKRENVLCSEEAGVGKSSVDDPI